MNLRSNPIVLFKQCDDKMKPLSRHVRLNVYEIIMDFDKYVRKEEGRQYHVKPLGLEKEREHLVFYSKKTDTKWVCDCKHFSHRYFECCHIYAIMVLNIMDWNIDLITDYLFYRMKRGIY